MQCFVYASQRKPDTYVWLGQRDRFDQLPPELHTMLGELRFVLEVDLFPGRRLPREDVATVMTNVEQQGWHLQLPPGEPATDPDNATTR